MDFSFSYKFFIVNYFDLQLYHLILWNRRQKLIKLARQLKRLAKFIYQNFLENSIKLGGVEIWATKFRSPFQSILNANFYESSRSRRYRKPRVIIIMATISTWTIAIKSKINILKSSCKSSLALWQPIASFIMFSRIYVHTLCSVCTCMCLDAYTFGKSAFQCERNQDRACIHLLITIIQIPICGFPRIWC